MSDFYTDTNGLFQEVGTDPVIGVPEPEAAPEEAAPEA